MTDHRLRIAISMGDPAGVGPEIVVKALGHEQIFERCIPIVVGDYEAVKDAIRFTGSGLAVRVIRSPEEAAGEKGSIDLIDLGYLKKNGWKYGEVSRLTGDAAFGYVKYAIELAQGHKVDGIVTAPINKEAIHCAGHLYSGHTEILADLTHTKRFAMLLANENLRVIHVTTHVSMEQACRMITKERVHEVIKLGALGARLLGCKHVRIGVAGFNPHSSENGLFGDQEEKGIIPAIEEARREGLDVDGPVPPDTVFVKAVGGMYDVVIAMYHDQGHIPLKLIGFKMDLATNTFTSVSGINCTIGLPFIRTSVDHGTAFDRAGKNKANEESMVSAIEAAVTMTEEARRLSREDQE